MEKEKIYFKIDGGIGRCICATSVIEEYAKNNKDKKVYVVTSFPYVFEGLEGIERVYPINTPYIYEDHISKGIFIEPEPYNNYLYYKDNKHLIQVFDKLINDKIDETFKSKIVLTENEKAEAKGFLDAERATHKMKIALIQPWSSSGGRKVPNEDKLLIDESFRSFGEEFAKNLTKRLVKEGYQPYFIKNPDQVGFEPAKTFNDLPARKIMALIPYADVVICCDSFLHHASAGLDTPTPTIVLWAGTNPENLAYKNHYNIKTEKNVEIEPNRIPHDHAYYLNKNKDSNEFGLSTIELIFRYLQGKEKKEEKV